MVSQAPGVGSIDTEPIPTISVVDYRNDAMDTVDLRRIC